MDNRKETVELPDKSSKGGKRTLVISPDVIGDFTDTPFLSETFNLVVFDPPHFKRNGTNGWMAKKYGKLSENWPKIIGAGFSECFRILKPNGVLVFKWNENEIPLSKILKLTTAQPLVGQRGGRNFQTHWVVFMKDAV